MFEGESLIDAVKAVASVTDETPSKWTVRRWCKHGLAGRDGRRVRLEHRIVGVKYKTSIEAVRRFFDLRTESMRQSESIIPIRSVSKKRVEKSLRKHFGNDSRWNSA